MGASEDGPGKALPGDICTEMSLKVERILTEEWEWWGGDEQRYRAGKHRAVLGKLEGQRQQDVQVLWWEFRLER